MKLLVILILSLTGCANVSTTKFVFTDSQGSSLVVELPKEMEAKKLVVDINAKEGKAKITADAIQTINVETIKAQAHRESVISGSISKGVAEGAVEGLKKSIIPIP